MDLVKLLVSEAMLAAIALMIGFGLGAIWFSARLIQGDFPEYFEYVVRCHEERRQLQTMEPPVS